MLLEDRISLKGFLTISKERNIPLLQFLLLFKGVQSLGVTGLVTLLENFFHIEGKNASLKQMKAGTNREHSLVHQGVPWPVGISLADWTQPEPCHCQLLL